MTDKSRDHLLHDRTSFHAVRDLQEDDALKAVEINLRGSQFLKSFRVTGNDDDLSRAIDAYEEAVTYLSEDDPKLAAFLNDIVDGCGTRFVRFGKLDDLEKAITIGHKVVEMTTEDDTNFPSRLNDLAIAYSRRFERLGHMDDISEAIRLHKQVIKLTSDGHAGLPGFLNDFGISLSNRFERTDNMDDISKAIRYQQRAVRITPDGHAELPCWLNNLGNLFLSRFEFSGDMQDNSEAIRHLRKAVRLTPEGSADLPSRLENLGTAFWDRFEQTGNMDDISAAIQHQEKSVQLTPDGHAELPGRLSNLGNSLSSRFEKTGNLQNISEGIQHLQRAVQLTTAGDADLPLRLSNLGDSLSSRFERTGAMDDISAAIRHQQKAVELIADGHAELPGKLQNLGVSLLRRSERTGDMDDILVSIRHLQQAVRLTPKGAQSLPSVLNNLANSLSSRFEHTGDIEDLSEAIGHLQEAVRLTPAGRAGLPAWLNGLGSAFLRRFELTRDMDDISEAIRHQKRAVQLTQRRDAALPAWLNNLGSSFSSRFERTGDMDDIEEAIRHQKEAVRLTPRGHAELRSRLNNLGISLRIRFERTEDIRDISEAIRYQEEALRLTPEGHSDLPARSSNLGLSLLDRFKCTKNVDDILLAIRHQQNAVQLTPDGHPGLPLRRLHLGDSFLQHFNTARSDESLQSAILNFHLSATSASGSPSLRLTAAEKWATALSQSVAPSPSDLLDCHSCIIHLISLFSNLAHSVQRRYKSLLNTSLLSLSAAAVAISLGHTDKALEWLVEGRCIVWNQINQIRTPIAKLRSYDTGLAQRFSFLSNKLENAGLHADSWHREGTVLSMDDRILLEIETKMHIKHAKDWEELLDRIRKIPQFKDFLQPRKCADIMSGLPDEGPIVILNIYPTRCDALALIPGAHRPKHIPLAKFSFQEAVRLANGLHNYLCSSGVRSRLGIPIDSHETDVIIDFPTVLEVLWSEIARPILEELAFSIPDSSAKLPRIWWCPTGPLTFLPIHAAGIYHQGKGIRGECLSDFAISSYIPTVHVLEASSANFIEGCRDARTGLLLIGQPKTPGKTEILFAREEVEKIERQLGVRGIPHFTLIDATATVSHVLESMERFSCIHLACHASHHPETPFKSSIHLDDGPLELSEIMKKNIHNADFSFLSACQTSMGDLNISEEVVHLASGMLAAGYRSVVGTMWSVLDEHGPDVAESFYRVMLDSEGNSSIDGRRAARALHHALKELRGKISGSPYSFLAWVPYVHIGI